MNRIKDIFKDTYLYLCGMITIIFFGVFVLMQYAPDTYFAFTNSTKAVMNQFISGGRLVTAFSAGICIGVMKLSDKIIYFLSYIFAIICTMISLYKFCNLLNKDIKNKTICLIIATLIIINAFSFELFVYIEKGIMMLSVLMCILAVEQINKWFNNKSLKHAIIALCYVMIATCSYQGTVGIFVAISLFYIIKHSGNTKEFLLNNVKVATIYGIPAITNFLIVKFLGSNSRVKGQIVLSESIEKIIQGLKNLIINTYNILPKYIFLLAIIGIIFFITYKIVISKDEKKKVKILKFIGIIYIFAGTLVATIAPQILQNTNSIWFVARSSYPMASIIGILLIYIFYQFDIKELEKNIITIIIILFLIIQLFFFLRLAIDGYIVNYKDKQETNEIIKQIEKFEKDSSNQITKIAIYYDKNTTYVHPDIRGSGDINVRALCTNWASKFIINYYSGRKLENTECDNKIKEKFSQEDWNQYDNAQIILKNDTIHLCIY